MKALKKIDAVFLVQLALGIVFASVLLPTNVKSIAIIIFGASVLNLILGRKWYFNRGFFIVNTLVYILLIFSLIYSQDVAYGIKKLTTMLSLVLFPLIFALINKEERAVIFKNLNIYLSIYVFSVFLFNVIALVFWLVNRPEYDLAQIFQHFPTLVLGFMGKYSIHPIYLSMHIGVALLFSFYIIRDLNSKKLIAAILAIDLTLVFFLLWFAKKGPLIALVLIFTLFVAFQRKKKFIRPYIIVLCTLIFLVAVIPTTRNKFIELMKMESLENGTITSTNIRYSIYANTQELIAESPFFGYGIGDYNHKLHQNFKKNKEAILVKGGYNAHNQFLSFLLIGGIIALGLFGLTIGVNLVYAIRFDNQILILLVFFYIVIMFTENILEREDGVIYFAFFLSYFGMFNKEIKQKLISHPIT